MTHPLLLCEEFNCAPKHKQIYTVYISDNSHIASQVMFKMSKIPAAN